MGGSGAFLDAQFTDPLELTGPGLRGVDGRRDVDGVAVTDTQARAAQVAWGLQCGVLVVVGLIRETDKVVAVVPRQLRRLHCQKGGHLGLQST